jgi:ribosomal RNA-processing protein 12
LFCLELDQQEIGKYAKNYLPLLFNLYTTEKWNHSRDPVRQSIFETIKRYLTITDLTLCQTFFDKSLEKTLNTDLDQITLYEMKDFCFFRKQIFFIQGCIYWTLFWH